MSSLKELIPDEPVTRRKQSSPMQETQVDDSQMPLQDSQIDDSQIDDAVTDKTMMRELFDDEDTQGDAVTDKTLQKEFEVALARHTPGAEAHQIEQQAALLARVGQPPAKHELLKVGLEINTDMTGKALEISDDEDVPASEGRIV